VWVATVIAPTQARAAPGIHAHWLRRVAPLTAWQTPQSLLVLRTATGPEGARWLLVRLGYRPNGQQAWIYADDTVLRVDPWRITVSRSTRRLRVFLHDRLERQFSVVVGKPSTPTPPGLFAIAAKLLQPDPNEFLGSWVMPLTAHSEVLKSFDGGDGQVALHGRGGESLLDPLGSARSHGCVRMANSAIGWVAIHIPVGTPVLVS
jgi:lipoprotein-anchoring transpeptidase ErfK/SrfK